ncbi:MAG: hypothetical protein COA50_11315 [Flavobacteriaceae bacterium]|nr:MAG: hypothetical protein COA50_11315 [Flavobacteriaceae bacterium]
MKTKINLRSLALISLVFILNIVILGCQSKQEDAPLINQLPELPLEELAKNGKLIQSKTEPIITLVAPKVTVPENPNTPVDPNSPQHCPTSRTTTTKYYTQVTYPLVVCYPNNAPDNQVLKMAIAASSGNGNLEKEKLDFPPVQYYKLSTLNNQNIANPLFCTVKGGPWAATVFRTTSCGCVGTNLDEWVMLIPSFPDINLKWYGNWDDIPSHLYPGLGIIPNDLVMVNETSVCCPGLTLCPNGFCVPSGDLTPCSIG